MARHDDQGHAQFACDITCVHGTGAAAHHQGQAPRIDAALHRNLADRRGHVGVDHAEHRRRRRDRGQAERFGDAFRDGLRGLCTIQPHAAPEKELRVEIA